MAVAAEPAALRVEPSLQEVRGLAREHNLVPLRHSFIDDCETPVSAFLKLRGQSPEHPAFLLESAEQGQRVGRWSFIGVRPRKVLRWSLRDGGDPYALARDEVARHRQAQLGDLPPFAGGAVGFFGYDLVRAVEPLGEPNPDPVGLPDMALIVSEALVAFDHMRHELTLIAYAFTDDGTSIDEAYDRALATIAEAHERLRGPVPTSPQRPPADPPPFESNMSRAGFDANVARIIEYIRAGDAFQVVPSQRFSAPATVEAFSIYRGLRTVNPSTYMYFLDFGDFQTAGGPPEPLVKV